MLDDNAPDKRSPLAALGAALIVDTLLVVGLACVLWFAFQLMAPLVPAVEYGQCLGALCAAWALKRAAGL